MPDASFFHTPIRSPSRHESHALQHGPRRCLRMSLHQEDLDDPRPPPIGDLETNPKKSQNQEALQVSPHPQLSLEANEDERGLGLVSSHRKQSIRHPEPIESIECVPSPSFRAPSCLRGPSSSRTTPTPHSSISTAKPSCSSTFYLAFSYFLSLARHPPSHPSCRTWMTS